MAKKFNANNQFAKNQLEEKLANKFDPVKLHQKAHQAKVNINLTDKDDERLQRRHETKVKKATEKLDKTLEEKQNQAFRAGTHAYEATQAFIAMMLSIDSPQGVAIKKHTDALARSCDDFVTGKIDLKTLKQECRDTLKDARIDLSKEMTRKPETILEHLSMAMRSLFRVLDKTVSWALGSKQTMAETSTPGAKFLTGRDHFFNKLETKLGTEMRNFHET